MRKWKCTVCGYIHTGNEPPEKCPVCGADKSLFEPVGESAEAAAQAGTETAAKWRCTVCGYIHTGNEPPEKCPVCGADKSLFEPVGESAEAAAQAGTETAAKWRCTVCGYIHTGNEPPEKCPVCGADKSLFEPVGESAEAAAQAGTETAAKWRCTVCGYIHTGDEPPDKCPVCGADKSLFEPMAETAAETESPAGTESVAKWRCTVCGYIHTGDEPPKKCPVCGADKSLFEALSETAAPEKSADAETAPRSSRGRIYDMLIEQMLKHHAHPVSVHIPNGVIPMNVLFILMALLFHMGSLELAAFCNTVFVVLTMPFIVFSGYIEWQKRYGGHLTNIFVIKILCATVVAASAVGIMIWWIIDPNVADATSPNRWLFFLVNLMMLGAAAVAGFIGGRFVFKD
ncbi:rubredoxin [Desulfonema ishimotonii]|uniref:Rubredoxin n=1 Tax=Desulfonema ishimotonii TaxID=45657 RepID=A0A401G3X9_9BACT|nr:hypothetical protein [Desulfonema ishimotonii]GBC63903.1 rubredoxin [Desulfonema ishimotonii]